MRALIAGVTSFAIAGAIVVAQTKQAAPPPPKPAAPAAMSITASVKGYYNNLKGWISDAAEQMKEADYGFRPQTMPAPDKKEIRTFGQLIGHIAQENHLF